MGFVLSDVKLTILSSHGKLYQGLTPFLPGSTLNSPVQPSGLLACIQARVVQVFSSDNMGSPTVTDQAF